MKSILALLAVVAIANAGIVKSGGLKGSWTDVIPLSSPDADLTAPGVAYYDSSTPSLELDSDYYNFDETYFVNMSEGYNAYYSSNGITASFAITGELDTTSYSFYYTGSVDCLFWTGPTMATATNTLIPDYCYGYYDNTYYCDFTLSHHLVAGDYSLYCVAADMNGNTAMITPDSFDVADQPMFTLAENFADMTAPVISDFTLTGGDVTLDSTSQVYAGDNMAAITVTVDDGEWEESDNYDPYSSGLTTYGNDVWVTIVDEMDNSWDFVLDYDTSDSDTGAQMYSLGFFFSNMFAEGDYEIVSVAARDMAGNVNTMALTTGNVISISNDDGAADLTPFSCQTLTVTAIDLVSDPEPAVTADASDYVSVMTSCETKDDSGSSFVAIHYQSDAYTAAGWSEDAMYNVWTDYSDLGVGPWADSIMPGTMQTDDADYSASSLPYIGNYYTSATTQVYYDTITFPPAAPEADYWLVEVYTAGPGGVVQLYDLAEGAASSVVPSVFAVAVAAVVALLRL